MGQGDCLKGPGYVVVNKNRANISAPSEIVQTLDEFALMRILMWDWNSHIKLICLPCFY